MAGQKYQKSRIHLGLDMKGLKISEMVKIPKVKSFGMIAASMPRIMDAKIIKRPKSKEKEVVIVFRQHFRF